VRNFAQLGALHTICDADPKVLEQFTSRYPEVNVEREYHQVLQNHEMRAGWLMNYQQGARSSLTALGKNPASSNQQGIDTTSARLFN
jgi:hypothetical protein